MKKTLFIYILQCFFSFISFGQTGFMKSYSIVNVQPFGVAILAEEDRYIVISSCDYCLGYTCTGVISIKANGNLLWNNLFTNTMGYLFPQLNGISRLNENSYIISGNSSYPGYSWQNFFLQMSNEGDSLKLIEYGNENINKGGDFVVLPHSIIAIVHEELSGLWAHIKFLKLNLALNEVSEIPLPIVAGYPFTYSYDISSSHDSAYLYLGIGYQPSGNTRYGQIRKVDTLGNELWRYSLSGNVGYTNPQMRVKTMPDGNVVVKWFDGVYSNILGQCPYLLCLNSEGEYVWRYDFYDTYEKFIVDIAITQNGDIIGCGYAFKPGYNYEVGWLFRMSSDGELLWEREYISYTPIVNFLVPVSITEDTYGNILATGGILDVVQGGIGYKLNTLLLKVLPNGCFTPGCNGGAEDTLIIASTVVGVESVPKPPPQVSGVSPLVVFPNPTNGVVQILLPAQRQNAQILFTNLSGHTLKTVPVPATQYNQSQMSIDTIDLPDGMYILSYEVAGKIIATAKLVVAK